MLSFFTIVTPVYTAIHAYIFWRLRAAFGSGPWQFLTLFFFLAMITLGFLRRQQSRGPVMEAVSWFSFIWMGLMLIAVTWFLLLDVSLAVLRLADWATGADLARLLRPQRAVPPLLCLVLILGAYALYEAHAPRVIRLALPTAKLPAGVERLRLVAVSDVHIGPTVGVRQVRAIVDLARKENPDLFLMLGDLVDANMNGRHKEEELLRSVPARYGKFAVLGNHEAYRGEQNSLRFTRAAGFRVLRGEAAEAGGITVIGVDDQAFGGRQAANTASLPLLQNAARNRFTLLLQHRPLGSEKSAGLFDLQLSGHTHGGQLWPARHLVRRIHKFAQGLNTLNGPKGTGLLYLSNGAGYWGPPMRLWTPPEVVVIDLVPAH